MNTRPPRPAKKIGRKRRAAGWMLLALGVLVAGVWVASWPAPWQYNWQIGTAENFRHWEFVVARGCLSVYQPSRIHWGHRDYPLWPIPPLLWTPAALLLRSGIIARRRALTGICVKCGYSLAGLAKDAPCPECGKGAAST